MGKITNLALATLISERLREILDLTGMTIAGLASFSGLNTGMLRAHYSKSSTITVENLAKICTPLGISLSHLLDADKMLSIDIENLSDLKKFLDSNRNKSTNYIASTEIATRRYRLSIDHKEQRDFIAYMVYISEYYLIPKTIEQMVEDFQKDYKMQFSAERIYNLLKKYVGQAILERAVSPGSYRSSNNFRQKYIYSKRSIKP